MTELHQQRPLFSFPAVPPGPPSRRNWYQELLDDPGCHNDPVSAHFVFLLMKSYFRALLHEHTSPLRLFRTLFNGKLLSG